MSTMFTDVNEKTSEIAAQVGRTPQNWNSSVFSMIQNLSESVVVPIAGIIITLVLCYELISMLTERNNLHDVDTWMFFKYFVKAWVAIYLVSNTFTITMAVFDVGQSVVNSASGIINGETAIDVSSLSINDLEKSRDYRCRPYEYQIENGFMVTSENYVLGYKASLIQGVTPGQIRERMEKLNPDRFRVRKFGVSDVIVTSIGGKMQSYYVNPKELIKFNGFFTKLPNGEYLLLNEEGYQVEGQKGTWTVTDEKTIDEQRFVMMVSDQKPDLLPSIVVQSDGKFMTTAFSGFDNATVRKVRELLHHEKFLENGTAERARESGTEQNYNMIDGCVNNVPKKPRVIGGRVSVLDRLHIKQAERARKDNAQVQQQERTRKN